MPPRFTSLSVAQTGLHPALNTLGFFMKIDSLMDLAIFHAHRVAGYVLLNLADDAAILAFMFC